MQRKEPPRLNLSFPQKSKVQPKGFVDVSVRDVVTVIIKGKVTSVSENADEWDPGKRLGLEITTCTIEGPPQKPVTIAKALKTAQRRI